MITYCVWAKFPRAGHVFTNRQDGWSRVAGEMTQEQAEWLAGQLYFQARAMPDAGPNHTIPVQSIAIELCRERHPGNIQVTGHPCEFCWEESRRPAINDLPLSPKTRRY